MQLSATAPSRRALRFCKSLSPCRACRGRSETCWASPRSSVSSEPQKTIGNVLGRARLPQVAEKTRSQVRFERARLQAAPLEPRFVRALAPEGRFLFQISLEP